MPRGPAARSLAQQAFALRALFPSARADLSPKRLIWRETITPTPLSRCYPVRITYRIGRFPDVRVLGPALEGRPGESIPHLFSNGTLCLHLENEWSSDMLVVHTTVPWTSEWLLNYEIWLATGTWYGGGEWPPRRQANSTPLPNIARSRRRRANRRKDRTFMGSALHRRWSASA